MVSGLAARAVEFAYPLGGPVLAGVDVELAPGELVFLVGPNGSGKSTLLKVLAGLAAPTRGAVTLEGAALSGLAARERARRIALVPQALRALPDASVADFVLAGRYAHHTRLENVLGTRSAVDAATVERALREADALELAARALGELSLGQFQRVLVARALAQEAPYLLLDEPTAALDPDHQVKLLLLIERLVAAGRAALVVTHELALASRFASRVLVLAAGRVVATGSPLDVFRREVLAPVFGPHLLVTPASDGSARTLVVPWPGGGEPGAAKR